MWFSSLVRIWLTRSSETSGRGPPAKWYIPIDRDADGGKAPWRETDWRVVGPWRARSLLVESTAYHWNSGNCLSRTWIRENQGVAGRALVVGCVAPVVDGAFPRCRYHRWEDGIHVRLPFERGAA